MVQLLLPTYTRPAPGVKDERSPDGCGAGLVQVEVRYLPGHHRRGLVAYWHPWGRPVPAHRARAEQTLAALATGAETRLVEA